MVKKCRGIAEIAGMEVAHVGVMTRARAALALSATNSTIGKRRKVNSGSELKFPRTAPSCTVQRRSRKQLVLTPENSVSPAALERDLELSRTESEHQQNHCSSPILDHVPVSRCSSNYSSINDQLVEKTSESVNLEGEINDEVEAYTYDCGQERRESTPSSYLRAESENMDSTSRPTEESFRRRSTTMPEDDQKIMPTDSEIEEFFTAAEKDIQKRFSEKYNYDIVKDVPLQGRYEWVQLTP